jgi:hypothetical protein
MHHNSLTPSKLFGIILLLFAVAGALIWVGRLVDIETAAFDVQGWILLGSTLGVLLSGWLFLRRVRWVRLPTSILLHILVLALLATLPFTVPGESISVQTEILALTLLAAGLLFLGILALHSEAMKNDLARGRTGRLARPAHLLIAGGCVLALAVLGAWHVAPLLAAQPVITVDYLARVNRAGKPARYDPSHNAASFYQEFFSQFTPLPETLPCRWKSWPADWNPAEYRALEEWTPVNESALAALAQGAQCPYWWRNITHNEDSSFADQAVELERVRLRVWSALLLAKYKASRGEPDAALRLLADLHMCGVHQIRNGLFGSQMAGTGICGVVEDTVLAILDRCAVGKDTLRQTLDTFTARTLPGSVPRFSEMERACGRDEIQRAFTNDNRGSGRLIPAKLYGYKKRRLTFYRSPMPFLDAVRVCLTHPRRHETIVLFEEYFTGAGRLARQTPWELYTQDTTYEQRVTSMLARNYFLQDLFGSMGRCIRIGWRARASAQGTVATLAVLTYRAQEGRLPESLQQLVDTGLLTSVPLDPYSGQPFIYRATDQDFMLYSAGEDFVDDGGLPCDWDDDTGGDHVFWPVPHPDTDADLLEWFRNNIAS